MLEGILPVLKPVHFTSHDVVAKVRGILRIRRIGHTGTLDPEVTGVLPLCIGRATRVVEYIQDLPKEYEAIVRFGITTDTEDMTGTVIEQIENLRISEDEFKQILSRFIGSIEQTPPMYSAVKMNGKRLYELARAGVEIDRKSRVVTIFSIETVSADLDKPYPEVKIRVRCSKGTYIRTLCVDIGKAMGFPSVMSQLVRTSTGNISLNQCISLSQIEMLHQSGQLEYKMIPTDQSILHIPAFHIMESLVPSALQGKKISISELLESPMAISLSLIRLYSESHRFLGVYQLDYGLGMIIPIKVFL